MFPKYYPARGHAKCVLGSSGPYLEITQHKEEYFPVCSLISGEDFLASALHGDIKADNQILNIFVNGYDTDAGLSLSKTSYGGSKKLSSAEFDMLCKNHKVWVNWM